MEDGNSIIYGLEHQTRALSPQYGEGEAIRFLIGTQSLKPNANQVHVVELEEDTGALHTKVYKHSIGEVWQLRGSPHDPALLATTHNAYDADTAQCYMGASIYRLPTLDVIPKDLDDLSAIQGRNPEDMELLRTFTPEKREEEVRSCEWHGLDPSRVALVSETSVTLCDVTTGSRTETLRPAGRARDKYTAGKWNPHQGHTQLAILQDTHIKCVDTRSPPAAGGAAGGAGAGAGGAWSVEAAHAHLVRDIDFNPNRQFQLASVGDDGALRIWDYRSVKQALFTRTDHSHWVWTVRYNPYHEQLVLTGSSDGRALLTAAASVCAPPAPAPAPAPGPAPAPAPASAPGVSDNRHNTLEDGVLQSYEQHEDSVYCCEWSGAEPWTFASLSYDARLVISRVPRHFKYKILL